MNAISPTTTLSATDLNMSVNHEPRIRDLTIAERLGMADPHMIRRLIERNRPELETYGPVSVTVTETSDKGGRPSKTYWLNEGQCLVICALSRTPAAAAIRKEVIELYMAYRRGQLPQAPATKTVTVRSHLRRVRDKAHDPRQLMLPPPVIRDGIGMVILGNEVVWYDGIDLGWTEADCVVISGDGIQAARVTRETDHDSRPFDWRRRSALAPWRNSLTSPGAGERMQVRIVGRVIARRAL